MRRVILAVVLLGMSAHAAEAQPFSSGSTGFDGPFDWATKCPTASACYVTLPYSGTLNYTTINVPVGKTVYILPNIRNTPATILATLDVRIDGTLEVRSGWDGIRGTMDRRLPGAGGYPGGKGGPGLGPGGGVAANGRWVGPISLVPLVGGSGGGSINGSGGGGGGALLLASSGKISISGTILADGSYTGGSSFGSGGAIRIVANEVAITTSGQLYARCGGISGYPDNDGVILVETPTDKFIWGGYSQPPIIPSTINPVLIPTSPPMLTIVSIGGYAVPAYSGVDPRVIDLLLPRQLADPLSVVVHASGVPVGTTVSLTVNPSTGVTSTPVALTGTLESSSATLSISGVSRSGLSYIFVYTTFDVAQGAGSGNPPGPDHVASVHLEAAPGGATQMTLLRDDGSAVDASRLPAAFLERVGYRR